MHEYNISVKMLCFVKVDIFGNLVLFYIFFCSFSCIIICGNLLVITSIIYFKQLHTPTNFLILSLAVSDLLVGVLILPYTMIPTTILWCVEQDMMDFYLCASSVWNLCSISVERYYAVCQPLRYRTKINFRVIMIMILFSSTLPGLTIMAGIFELFGFFFPAIIMSIIYLKILTVALRQARSIQNTTCQSTKSESKMERKATKTLAIVMGVFLMCWTPYFLFSTIRPMREHIDKIAIVMKVWKWLGWSNSMLNPFIYGFFYSWFRSAFRMILSGKIFQGDFTHSKLS